MSKYLYITYTYTNVYTCFYQIFIYLAHDNTDK